MKHLIFILSVISCFVFSLNSCASVKPADSVASQPVFTHQDSVNEEIKNINLIKESDLVKALWKSYILKNNSEGFNDAQYNFNEILEECKKKFNLLLNSEEEKNYLEAFKFALSINAVDSTFAVPSNLEMLKKQAVPGLNNGITFLENKKVSQFINGTVTVLVDKGIKIKNGIGSADSVLGSGFFISKNGYIITNYHVVADCVDPKYEGLSRLYIKLANDEDTRIPAKVIGWDEVLDLALLKTEVDAPYVFNLGSSESLDVGDTVFAIGSPLGLERTLTRGIISAKDRKLFTCGNVFQLDAAVNSGNSGGPVIDSAGNVQAIVFAGVQNHQGLNFAIPVEYLKAQLPVLFNNSKGGKLVHPWIGAYGKTEKTVGVNAKNAGVKIFYLMPGGSGFCAGLKEDQIIVGLNGKNIYSLEDLQRVLMEFQNGTIVKFNIKNSDGTFQTIPVFLEDRPKNPGYEFYTHDLLCNSFYPLFGMKLTSVSDVSRKKFVVSKVMKGSAAEEYGLSVQDPVVIFKTDFNNEKTILAVNVYTKKQKNGYIDVNVLLTAMLDSPYIF